MAIALQQDIGTIIAIANLVDWVERSETQQQSQQQSIERAIAIELGIFGK